MNAAGRTSDGSPRSPGPRHIQAGFNLVEVLIAATIAMVAVTGLATLQILALRAAGSSLQRSQATELVYEMIDRLRVNRGANGLTTTALGGGYDNRTLCHTGARGDDTQPCGIGTPEVLTGTDAASVDLRAWWNMLNASALPHWYAGIMRTGEVFTITVQWDDTRAADAPADADATRTSCLGSQMPDAAEEVCVMTQL